MSMPEVVFVPYQEFTPWKLAWWLSRRYATNRKRIKKAFPVIAKRYWIWPVAWRSVVNVIKNVAASNGEFFAFAVTVNGKVVGVATFSQQTLLGRGALHETPLASGPLVAYWFGARKKRPKSAPSPLLPVILPLLAQKVRESGMPGRPWTVVIPNGHSIECLTDVDNGFGGFVPWHGVSDYVRVGDGVNELRILFNAVWN